MAGVLFIDLKGIVQAGASIEFLRADVPLIEHPPCALIRYSVDGQPQPQGLRLDLYKQVFLDHFEEGSPQERVLNQAAPHLLELVYSELGRGEPAEPTARLNLGGSSFEFDGAEVIVGRSHRR